MHTDEPLTPAVFHVLLALGDGPRHGYGIMQAAAQTSGIGMGPGTVYGTLRRLEEAGRVEEVAAPPEETDPRRRYFSLTPAGRDALGTEAQRIANLADLVRARRLAPARGSG
jgi:DNA-binding PadR family transcriptional regulator